MNVQIRPAKQGEDEAVIASLWIQLARDMVPYSELNEISEGAEQMAREGFADILGDDDCTIFLLSVNNQHVGYMFLSLGRNSILKYDRYVKIVDLFVEEEYRSQGYGDKLVHKAQQWGEERDCDYIAADTEWDNDGARRFFQDQGMEEKQVSFVKRLG